MLSLFVCDNSRGEHVIETLPSDDKVHFEDLKAVFAIRQERSAKKLSRVFKNKHACFYSR